MMRDPEARCNGLPGPRSRQERQVCAKKRLNRRFSIDLGGGEPRRIAGSASAWRQPGVLRDFVGSGSASPCEPGVEAPAADLDQGVGMLASPDSPLEARVEKTVKEFLKKANVVTSDELKAVKKEVRELKKMISSEKEKS